MRVVRLLPDEKLPALIAFAQFLTQSDFYGNAASPDADTLTRRRTLAKILRGKARMANDSGGETVYNSDKSAADNGERRRRMEKERQGPRPQGGRAAARGNARPSAPSVRSRANIARPYQSAPRHSAATPPPPYIPPAYPGRYPTPGRKTQGSKPSPTIGKANGRELSLTTPAARTRQQPLTNAKPSAAKTQEELAEERFRDALWPQTKETPFQRRTAFLLSLLYALIYIACSLLLIHPLNVLTARMPFPVSDIVRASLPACAGTLLCALTRLRFPDEPRMMLLAYRRLFREILLIFVALQVLIWGEWDAQRMIARFALQFVSGPLVVGTAAAVLSLYLDWLYIEADEEEDA